MDGPLTDEQEKQVHAHPESAVELSEMVDDLLDLAKIEAGRISISPAWFEMVDLFAALRGMFKPLLTMTTVSLVFEEPRDLPRIYTDDKRLSQILRNFISNALKFTQEGEVRVRAQPEGTTPSRSAWPTRASASPRSITPPSSRISCRSIRRCSENGAARGSVFR